MTTHLNTLYVTTHGAYLSKDHDTVIVSVEGKKKAQVPMLHLAGVVCMARVTVTPELMAGLHEQGVGVSFFNEFGRFLARVEGIPAGSVTLRRAQFRAADDNVKTLVIARAMVIGKIVNCRTFLQHAARDATEAEGLAAAVEGLKLRLREAALIETLEGLRGVEGLAARTYWGVFNCLLKKEVAAFSISGRSRRPPKDRSNALLSFGYSLLTHDCTSAAAAIGLDPAVGFLHEDRPGRMSLALDLMEELRAPMVDRFVVSLINRGQVVASDLEEDAVGGWTLKKESRKAFLVAWQEMKQSEIEHPFLEQQTTWLKVPSQQALLLGRFLRGDIDAYPPFTIR